MWFHQSFGCPPLREDTAVADVHGIIHDFNLDRNACSIIIMAEGVIDSFPHTIYRERISFHSYIMLIGDYSLQILGVNKVNHTVCNAEKRTINHILIQEVRHTAEPSYFHITPGDNPARPVIEKHSRCPLEFSIHHQIKMIKKFFVGNIEIFFGHTLLPHCLSAEYLETFIVEILNGNIVHRNSIPVITCLPDKELSQYRTPELLFCASATIMKLPFVADRVRTGINADFNIFLAIDA